MFFATSSFFPLLPLHFIGNGLLAILSGRCQAPVSPSRAEVLACCTITYYGTKLLASKAEGSSSIGPKYRDFCIGAVNKPACPARRTGSAVQLIFCRRLLYGNKVISEICSQSSKIFEKKIGYTLVRTPQVEFCPTSHVTKNLEKPCAEIREVMNSKISVFLVRTTKPRSQKLGGQ